MDEALLAAEAGVEDTWVQHGDKLALQRRVLRLGKPPRRCGRKGPIRLPNRKEKSL